MNRIYICIDLKSFYASVECVERGLDPMITNLVVADEKRTEKTVCLAVTPSLKCYGIKGRARLYEVIEKVNQVNCERKMKAPKKEFIGESFNSVELKQNAGLKLKYIIAKPRMAYYMKYSTEIYKIYLKYFSSEDIYVYSIDEVFCDATEYLNTYKMSAYELTTKIIQDVYSSTRITATAGIGSNLYLAKVAMDIWAKHVAPNKYGVRIAELDEMSYRKLLWNHRPLTDFWRIGRGYLKKLEARGIYTMGDIARCSINNEDLLYKLFGVNAELLIDHSWGYEPCTIKDIKAYKPSTNSISSGQVLHCPCDYEKTKINIKEMAELLALDLVEKNLVTSQLVLTVEYDVINLKNKEYKGEIKTDFYGRKIPKHAHGTINLSDKTSSSKLIMEAFIKLYDRIIDKNLLTRKIYVIANNVVNVDTIKEKDFEQINLFANIDEQKNQMHNEERQRKIQNTMLNIKNKYGKNAIIRGINLVKGGTTIERNNQIGGHNA